MQKYKITIREKESIDLIPKELTGEFTAQSESHAIEQAKDFYSMELGTFDDNIEIIRIIKIWKTMSIGEQAS